MRMWRHAWIAALVLAACGQPQQQDPEDGAVTSEAVTSEDAGSASPLPPVDAALIAAPNTAFVAIEPSEIGVFGAPTIDEALAPLVVHSNEEGAGELHLSVRESGAEVIADIVRSNATDDSVSAGHLRIEFRRESDGWYPTNAFRRWLCARGALANQWTTELCP